MTAARDSFLALFGALDETSTAELDRRLGEHRTEVLAEVTAWLVKKAREFHVSSRKREREQGDTCAVLASKIARGAVRPDNLRMLPDAGFFEVDRTYEYKQWTFRCDAVTTHPDTGELTALGWFRFLNAPWQLVPFEGPVWADGWTDITEAGDRRG